MKFLAHVLAVIVAPAIAQTPEQRQLRDIYKELVEINTTDSAGSCTQAAEALKARLEAGGRGAEGALEGGRDSGVGPAGPCAAGRPEEGQPRRPLSRHRSEEADH